MRTLLVFLRTYPRRSLLMLGALLLAGVAEGIGLTTLLPLLSIAIEGTAESEFGRFIVAALESMGLDPTIGVLLLIIVIAMALRSLMLLLAHRQVGYSVAQVATDLRLDLIDALLTSSWRYYLKRPAGSLANSLATEAIRAAMGYEHCAHVIALGVQVILYTTIALLISWQATLVSLVVATLLVMILHKLVKAARKAGEKQTRLLRSLISYLTDVLGSVKPLKAMARDHVADALLRDQTQALNKALRREVITREMLRALQEPLLTALIAAGLYLALIYLGMALPEVLVLVFLLARLVAIVSKMQRRYQQLTVQESAYWSLRSAVEEARAAAESSSGTLQPSLEKALCLRQVTFAYGRRPVLKAVDLDIPARRHVSLIGPSGAGKSTILDLVCGLIEPQQGRILVDGVPLEQIDRRAWRRMIGYVPQETVLLHDSILNNIIVGESGLTEADVERALRQAGAWDWICQLNEGIHTIVGERGGRLSGGQRQRIAIARALSHRPRLLILDEPTSALDTTSEATICETLRALTGEYTIISVSHRPIFSDVADRVYQVRDGRVIAVDAPAGALLNST